MELGKSRRVQGWRDLNDRTERSGSDTKARKTQLFVKGSAREEEKEIIQSVNRAPMLMHSECSLDPNRVLDSVVHE